MVSGVDTLLEPHIWTPKWFEKRFGDLKQQVVDCREGKTHNIQMRKFWEGFENLSKRTNGAIYKLKDWPPGEDFREELPEQARDLDSVMPIFHYSTPMGQYNLAKRLPETFVRPDLGPKMYSAYGPALLDVGTTNLHLDVSDAVNVVCYVGVPKSDKGGKEETKQHREEVFRCLVDGGVDEAQVRRDRALLSAATNLMLTQLKRCQEKSVGAGKVGALWHIYYPSEADKIREFLNKVKEERGESVDADSDPIHDQVCVITSVAWLVCNRAFVSVSFRLVTS